MGNYISRRLTVRQLIKELKTMPQSAFVVWQDHDQSFSEINDFARGVYDVTEELKDHENVDGALVVAVRG